jgi:hypothetical protein
VRLGELRAGYAGSGANREQETRMLLLKDAIAFGRDEPIDLLHRTRCPPLVLAPTEEGRISLCGLTPRPSIARLHAPGKIATVSVHPSLPLLALIERGSRNLRLLRFDGSIAFEIPAPPLKEGSPEWMSGGYDHCLFDESGRYLWCAASVSTDQIELQLREADGWSVVSRTLVDDPFGASSAGASSAMLLPTAEPGTLSLWLAEGHGGGACLYWVARDGVSVRCSPEPSVCDTTPPEFSPSGREFLVIDLVGVVQRFSYPVVEQLGVCESPFGDDQPFRFSVCYLNNARALAVSLDGRIAVLDTSTMRVVNELIIEGHEPRPAEEHFYPHLAGDRNLCTDIGDVTRLGDYLIFGHAVAPPQGSAPLRKLNIEDQDDDDTQGMLCFPISYILDRYAA